jgi:hypothetical protein
MSHEKRSAFQQQVVEALIENKAIDLEAVGSILGRFGARAVLEGESLVSIINRNVMWNCGWPGPEIDVARVQLDRQTSR